MKRLAVRGDVVRAILPSSSRRNISRSHLRDLLRTGVSGIMKAWNRIVVIAGMMLVLETAQAAEDLRSANNIMRGCYESLRENNLTYMAGVCDGLVEALTVYGPGVCAPVGVTGEQATRVVVKYIQDRPGRLHEPFIKLALEGLRTIWPCHH
jgi:Rap1a immunity proteins